MNEEALHMLVEDDECDICEESAMPYDDYTDFPYCPVHAMECLTDFSIEDYTELDVELEYREAPVHRKVTIQISDTNKCTILFCDRIGVARIGDVGFYREAESYCVQHAAMMHLGGSLETLEDWKLNIECDFEEL